MRQREVVDPEIKGEGVAVIIQPSVSPAGESPYRSPRGEILSLDVIFHLGAKGSWGSRLSPSIRSRIGYL